MLSIDDLRKLADMQEKLLRISIADRDKNLEKYKDIVRQIDEYYFSNLLFEIEQVNEHNQTLEDELTYLEQISSTYEQVLVEQVKFKNVCELYGDKNLKLSDLSTIDNEYIDSRKNAISGYLINQKNIDEIKNEMDLLSGQLRDEEKKNNDLKKRLLGFEEVLRNNFINAEGRYLNVGVLEYVSVLSEYTKLGYDFKKLLGDEDKIKEILNDVYSEVRDADDKLKTAELCYDRIPSVDSKNILEEISLENVRVKYKLTMIKILELLSRDVDNYDMFLKKRKDLFDLIRYRLDFINKMGVNVSVDPFSRTKVFDQIKVVEAIEDTSKNIHRIRKKINELNCRLEDVIVMRDSEKEEINNVRDMIIIRDEISFEDDTEDISMNDIVMSNLDKIVIDDNDNIDNEDMVILDNQVVRVRSKSSKLNMKIVSQKTSQVIRRVNEMVTSVSINENKNIPLIESPELVIESTFDINDENTFDKLEDSKDNEVHSKEESIDLENDKDIADLDETGEELPLLTLVDDLFEDNSSVIDETMSDESNIKIDTDKISFVGDDDNSKIILNENDEYDKDIFMTVDPFIQAPLFTDRTDEDVFENIKDVSSKKDTVIGEKNISIVGNNLNDREIFFDNVSNDNEKLVIDDIVEDNSDMLFGGDIQKDLEEEMPDAFWTVQDEQKDLNGEILEKEHDVILSFDEQVALLRNNNDNNVSKNKTKVLKLDNNIDIDNKVA